MVSRISSPVWIVFSSCFCQYFATVSDSGLKSIKTISTCVDFIYSALLEWSLSLVLNKAGENLSFALSARHGGAECWDVFSSVCAAQALAALNPALPIGKGCSLLGTGHAFSAERLVGKSANLVPMVGPCCLFWHTFGFSNLLFSPMGSNSSGIGSTHVLSCKPQHTNN